MVDCTYEYLDSNRVRVSSPSFRPSMFEGRFADDCSTFTSGAIGGEHVREAGGRCGDGNRDADFGEVCDDGNRSLCEGACNTDCTRAVTGCGDGFVCAPEACDDGPRGSDVCTADCEVRTCGNGVIDPGEVCDDGNFRSGDGCREDCMHIEACGNEVLDPGERCDDGNAMAGDGCDADCQIEPGCRCGEVGEPCSGTLDPANTYELVHAYRAVDGEPEPRAWSLSRIADELRVDFEPPVTWTLHPVSDKVGTFVLTDGREILRSGGRFGRDSQFARSFDSNHWIVDYAGADDSGHRIRLSLQIGDQRSFLCPGLEVADTRLVGGSEQPCAWYVVGPLDMGACDWPWRCGDGELDAGEMCDDGNVVDGDGCSATCETEE